MVHMSKCPLLMTGVPSRRPQFALHMGVPHEVEATTRLKQQSNCCSLLRSLYYRQLPLHPRWWLQPLSPDQWPSLRTMPGATAVAVSTPALLPPTSAFVVAADPATQHESDLFFGDLEGLETPLLPDAVDFELVGELVDEIQHIKGNSGVGSPEVRKYVDSLSSPEASFLQVGSSKEAALRGLAEALFQRRPVLYLKGHAQAYPAQVLLRTVRKPSVGALSSAAAAAGLFKSPSNTVIVIKFDPQFGYADIIVDPFFTDAFIQQPSTPTYSHLLSQLPRAFVGTAVELRRVVALLTQQSMRAYASKGAACPPWRRFDAMLARWLPKSFTDEPITHGPGAAAAAPAELLRRSDISSSSSESGVSSGITSSSGWTFSLGAASSFSGSSSSGVATSVPRSVVHGFEIPAKAPAAAAAVAEPEFIQAAGLALLADPVMAIPQADAAVTSSEAAALDSVSVKLAAAATEYEAAAAAPGSWQLAVGRIDDVADVSDECLSSSSSSNDGGLVLAYAAKSGDGTDEQHVVGVDSARSPTAAAATAAVMAKPATPPAPQVAATAADPSVQLLAAYGYSSRVVKLQDPAAAAAAASAAARVHRSKRAYEPVSAASHERVCCGFNDSTHDSFALASDAAVACFDGTAGDQAGKQHHEPLGLAAAAVADIRRAVTNVGVAALMPVAGGEELWRRKVVRLNPAGGVGRWFVSAGPRYSSAHAA